MKYFYKVNGYGDITGFERLEDAQINLKEKELDRGIGNREYLYKISEEQYNWIMKYKPDPEILDIYLEHSEPWSGEQGGFREEIRDKILKDYIRIRL